MRIGLDYRPVTAAPYSGIARQALALEQVLLQSEGDTLERYTAAPAEHAHRQLAHCPAWTDPVHGLHRPLSRLRFEARFLPQALADGRMDVYIATANGGLPIGRRRAGLRQVLILHDVFQLTLRNHHANALRAWVYRGIDRFEIGHAVATADAIWTPSHYSASEAARLFPRHAHKLRVLPNAVAPLPPPSAAEALFGGPAPRYWLVVGTREPRKNVALFLRAWAEARQREPALPELVIVGARGDVPEALRELPGIFWFSGIDDAGLARLYADAERLWQPAYAEGFGLPVVEALAAGTPVAVAYGSALDEVAPSASPRFAAHDQTALVRLMLELAQAPRENAEACRAFARRFAPAAYAARVRELLDELR